MAADLNIEALLAPIAPEAPSGRDLKYDRTFEALMAAADSTPRAEQFPDGKSGPVMPPQRDFRKIRRDALALLGVGRDLRVLVVLVEALTASEGPIGFAVGLELLRRTLDDHWQSVHPALDQSEVAAADQALPRVNALQALADQNGNGTVRELARARLVEVPGLGSISLRQWDLATGRAAPTTYETKPTRADLESVLRAADAGVVGQQLAALRRATAEIEGIDALLQARIGATPDLRELTGILARMRALIEPYAAAEPTAAVEEEAVMEQAMAPASAAASPAATGGGLPARFESRDEVVRALELIVDYYKRREPGSAVPLLLERARRMVTMSFMETIGDLAPDAIGRLKDLLGPPP